jgi:hypothetical protein
MTPSTFSAHPVCRLPIGRYRTVAVPELQGVRTSAGRDRWAPAQVSRLLAT